VSDSSLCSVVTSCVYQRLKHIRLPIQISSLITTHTQVTIRNNIRNCVYTYRDVCFGLGAECSSAFTEHQSGCCALSPSRGGGIRIVSN
jgi:hypothetical protein